MLGRKIYDSLLIWKKRGATKSLCIIGARQIGKSTVARAFGEAEYKQTIEINFISHPEYKEIFSAPNPESIFPALTAATQKTIIPNHTLLILDEIQECPNARTAIKFLVQDGRVDLIETGSLLGVGIQKVTSYPVGFEEILPMYPMDFEEFLWALNIPSETIDYLHQCFEQKKPVIQAVHDQMLSLFYLYMAVGGMPCAVQTYVDSLDLAAVLTIQRSILDLYRLDISKFSDPKSQIRIQQIFDSIPGQLNAKNKRFKLSKINKTARTYQYDDSFLWLKAAGIALPCYNVTEPVYPLIFNENRPLFKLYFCDTGLLCALSGGAIQFELLKQNESVNYGSLLENVFAQSLKSRNFNLFYFDAKTIELDFVVENNQQIDVMEIKSGQYFKKHASLDKIRAQNAWPIHQSYVFCRSNIEMEDDILYLPYYMIIFYEQKKVGELIWKPDLSALMNLPDDLSG